MTRIARRSYGGVVHGREDVSRRYPGRRRRFQMYWRDPGVPGMNRSSPEVFSLFKIVCTAARSFVYFDMSMPTDTRRSRTATGVKRLAVAQDHAASVGQSERDRWREAQKPGQGADGLAELREAIVDRAFLPAEGLVFSDRRVESGAVVVFGYTSTYTIRISRCQIGDSMHALSDRRG